MIPFNELLNEVERLSAAEKWQLVKRVLGSLEQEQTVPPVDPDWRQFLRETYGSLRDTPIHVMLIEPGPVRTRIRENARAHYERWIDRENSVWAPFYRDVVEPRLYKERPPPDPFELSCQATSRRVVHALESRRPKPRYYVTTPTYIVGTLRRLLPTRLLDRVMMKG